MGVVLYIIIIFAIFGPFVIPAALLNRVKPPKRLAVIGLTNAITALPMLGITMWWHYFPAPSCRETSPGAPCDGIPASAVWVIFTLIFGVFALWGLIVSSVATPLISTKRKTDAHPDPHVHD